MKRILAIVLALALILTTFAACGKKKADAGEDTSEYEALYAPVLKKYKQGFDEGWSREKFMENSLSPNLAALDKTAEPSFAFLDLDGDKTPELFIGRADQRATVYDLYTATDDNAIKQVVTPTTEETYTLTNDNRLVKEDDSYETLDVVTFYELKDDALTPKDSYIHDEEQIINGMDAWFHATGDLPASESEFYAEDMNVITEAEYIEKTAYELGKLVMKTFAELVPADDDTAEGTVTPAEQQAPAPLAYEMKEETFEQKSSSGVLIYNNTVKYPEFTGTTPGELAAKAEIQKAIDECKTADQSMLDSSEGFFGLPFAVDYEFTVTYNANGYLSMLIFVRDWEGGAHPLHAYDGVTYEVSTGKEMTCDHFFNVSAGERDQMIRQAIERAGLNYYDNWEQGTPFTLTENGLCFHNHENEANPNAEVLIPYTPGAEPFIGAASESTESTSSDVVPAQDTPAISANVGEYITFGSYEQDNDLSNGKEPIEWLVLDRDGNKALVISKYGLDCQPYNEEYKEVTWETCTLRTWLNGTFYNSAFSSSDQNRIQTTLVIADRSPTYESNPGNNTQDKIFLLSVDEAKRYFSSDEARMCAPTPYAKAQGVWTPENKDWDGIEAHYKVDGMFACWWWLRSPGDTSIGASNIYHNGSISSSPVSHDEQYGYLHYDDKYYKAVRPAMWIALNGSTAATDESTADVSAVDRSLTLADVGEYITFGQYEQDNDLSNGAEPIEWLVLDCDGNKMFVVSRYALDSRAFGLEMWEDSLMRPWLNGAFYNKAFNTSEQTHILETLVTADQNTEFGADPGNDTKDKIFLLSRSEVNKYFDSDSERMCVPTKYAISEGVRTNSAYKIDEKATCQWWLRNFDSLGRDIEYVFYSGYIGCYEGGNSTIVAVRPAMWITVDA